MIEAEYNSQIQTTLCVLCEIAQETQFHLFIECEMVKPQSQTISRILTHTTNKHQIITTNKIFLGNFRSITIKQRKLVTYIMINAR